MKKKILIYNAAGGLGDFIQLIKLFESINISYPDHNIYLLQAHQNNFLKTTLKDLNINYIYDSEINILYFGFRLKHFFEIKKLIKQNDLFFDTIIDTQSKLRNTFILKNIPHKNFISLTLNGFFLKPKIEFERNKNNQIDQIIEILTHHNNNFKIQKYNIKKIDQKYFDEAEKILKNKNYVGISITQGNAYREKSINIETIIQIANYIVSKNKIPVFLIEKKYLELKEKIQSLVPEAKFPEFETDLNNPCLVIALSKQLEYAFTIDNGIMHLLSLSNTPMIAVFGPTSSKKFAPVVDFLKILDSKEINNSKNINTIKIENFFSEIDNFEKMLQR